MSARPPAGMPTGAWTGGAAGPAALCVLAPNASPMTLDGTNTWVLGTPGGPCVVVDPGPDDATHLRAVHEAVAARGSTVAAVLLTHGHADHSEGAAVFARACGSGVRALDPAHRLGDEGLGAGDVVDLEGGRLDVVATPGHTSDSLCFVLRTDEAPAVLTGDTVLGRGTTVVAHPDGRLADYLASLRRLEVLLRDEGVGAVLPGHGPVLAAPDVLPAEVVAFYLAHRAERLDQVRAAVAAGATSAREVVETVYAEVPRAVWPAAELSVLAQLEYLNTQP
nr:MBL fold metallo-hydrolase [Kineosporia sp. A_224]